MKWANNDKYFRGIYFLKQQTKSRNEKETENQREWAYGGGRVKRSAIQVSQWRVSVVREQAYAGTLEGFHLRENVKYSLKQFNKTKDRKEPDLVPPWQS